MEMSPEEAATLADSSFSKVLDAFRTFGERQARFHNPKELAKWAAKELPRTVELYEYVERATKPKSP